ncbi:MAG: hypothetical protein IBX63_08650 [Coriobacteriia bacterium]|nr:hypothetical protein [Coriobacteriia bacterium]
MVKTEIASGVVLSLEMTSTTLVAGSSYEASVTIANEGLAAMEISDWGPGIWITDSTGRIVLQPRRIRHPISLVPLEPGQKRHETETFTVPAPGAYSIQASWQISVEPPVGDAKTSPLEFTSVEP